jgi:small subunit ribosomal protein S8e
MGICRDSIHKKRLTGGKKKKWRKKRKYELGRQSSNTKIGTKRLSMIRVRGGSYKKRALSLEAGNFSYLSLNITKKSKIISVVYNSTNNELVRTNTLVKGSIIQIDSSAFREIVQKTIVKGEIEKNLNEKTTESANLNKKSSFGTPLSKRECHLSIESQIATGRLLARICSRPGQSGRVDGYVLEGIELDFYMKKIQKKNQ